MTDQLLNALSEIRGKEHFKRVFFFKKTSYLLDKNFNLLDLYNLPETEFSKFNKKTRDLITNFKAKVINEPEFFENYHKYVFNTPQQVCNILNPSKSVAYHILKSLTELSDLLRLKSTLPEAFFDKIEFNAYQLIPNYLDNYFGLNGNQSLSFEEIGLKYGKSSESIRTNLFESKNRPDLRNLFLYREEGFGLEINKILLSYVDKTFEECLYGPNFINCFTTTDEINVEMIKKLVEIFNLECIEVSFEDSNDNYYTIVNKGETLLYRGHIMLIDSLLREGEVYSKQELINAIQVVIPSLKNTKSNRYLIEKGINTNILDKLLNHYFKIEIIEDDEDIFYQFKWQYLSSLNAKVTRILYENDNQMHKNEILEEYNQRAYDSNIELITNTNLLNIKQTNKIKPKLKSGYWFYSTNENDEIKETIEVFIDRSISEKFSGKVTFDQIKDFIQNTPYASYPDNSIRANILLCCRRAVSDNNLFIHQNFIEKHLEIKTIEKRNRYVGNSIINRVVNAIRASKDGKKEQKDLENVVIDLLKNDEGINVKNGHYRAYLNKFIESGVILKLTSNDVVYYTIDEEELKNHDLNKLGKKSEPEYKKKIRAHAISYLKGHKKAKLSEIKAEVLHYIPNTIADNIFYKIFQDKDLFIKEQVGNETFISLETSLLPVPQELHVEVVEESTELLGTTSVSERVQYNLSKLKLEVINELSSEFNLYKMSKEVLSDSFDIFYTSFSNTDGNISRWGDSLLQSVYELLCTKTDYYDRETCLNKLITGYETFLRSFIPSSESKIFSGQAEVINYFNVISELRSYKEIDKHYRNDVQKTNFSYILSRIKYLSDVSRHDKNHESLEMGLNKQIKNAVDFIALYLYTGYLISNK